jgi:hypothetical protein
MTRREERQAIHDALAAQGIEAVYGKNGFWLRGQGHVTFAQARKLAGVDVSDELRRRPREGILYGDAAIIHAIAGKV